MKKKHQIFIIFFLCFVCNIPNFFVSAANDNLDYQIQEGDTFIWFYKDFDFIQQNYYLKLSIIQNTENNSLSAKIQTYYPNLNQSINETNVNIYNYAPEFEIGFLNEIDYFSTKFNTNLIYNQTQIENLLNNSENYIEKKNIAFQTVDCIITQRNNTEIWIDKTNGVVVRIEYMNVYTLEVVSWNNVDLISFAEHYEQEMKIKWVLFLIGSFIITGVIISLQVLIQKRRNKKRMKKYYDMFL